MSRALKALALLVATSCILLFAGLAAFAQGQTTGADATAISVRVDSPALGFTTHDQNLGTHVAVPDSTDDPNTASHSLIDYQNKPLIDELSVLKSSASRTDTTAHAEAHTGHVFLLDNPLDPVLKVDALHAVSDSKCVDGKVISTGDANIVDLTLNGQTIHVATGPNQVLPPTTLTFPNNSAGLRVTLNEQIRDAAGHGLTVIALHVVLYDTNTNLIFADIKVAQAHSTAYCPDVTNGGGEGGTDQSPSPVLITKHVSSTTSDANGDADGIATAFPGDTVTWVVTMKNTGPTAACQVQKVTDTLPNHFSLTSSKGDLTDGAAYSTDGQMIIWDNAKGYALAAGDSLVETLTVKIASDTPPGTYTNLFDVNDSTCGAFSSGEVGPVKVIAAAAAPNKPTTQVLGKTVKKPLAKTGVSVPDAALVAALMIGAGIGFRTARPRQFGMR